MPLLSGPSKGLLFLEPPTGKVRVNYERKFGIYRALQPLVISGDTVLHPAGMTTGTRAIHITKAAGQLRAEELCATRNLKPDITDLVSHQGFIHGSDPQAAHA